MLTNNLVSPRINNVQGTDSLDGKSMSIQKLTDEELVAKYKESRDHQYLTELFTRHSDVIYRNALRKMKNPADAEDIMQIAYIKMVTDILNFKGTGSVKGWMLQVVIFTCYDRLRSEKSRQNRDKKIMSERTQMTTPKNYELTEMIETHLNKLPEIYKLPITLQIMDGLTVKEVSDALKIPEKTIRSQIARGLEKLKVSLQSVGVTASIISLGDMLKGIQQPMAPEMFKSSQYFNALLQNKAATSTKLAISAGSKGVTLQKVVSGTMLSLLASCFIVLGYYLYKPKIEPAPMKFKKWDFENTTDVAYYQDIGLQNGSISLTEKLGLNGSNSLVLEEKSLIELDISKFEFPIKISYKTDVLITQSNFFLQCIFRKDYLKEQKLFYLFGLYEKIHFDQIIANNNAKFGYVGKWVSYEAYIDEDSIDCWINGMRGYFFQGKSNNRNKLFISVMGKSIIDDLIIESIDRKELPETKLCEEAVKALVLKDGVELYSIDKKMLGVDEKAKIQPKVEVRTVDNFESVVLGIKNEVNYPFLNEKNQIVWVREQQKMKLSWNFEDSNQFNDFNLIRGNLNQVGQLGDKGSMCMGVKEDSLIEFDISKFKLPLKITYSYDSAAPKSDETTKGVYMTKGNYQKDKNIFYFTKISPALKVELNNLTDLNKSRNYGFLGKWFSATIYVSEECIDLWFDGNRKTLVYGKSNDNQKLFLQFLDKTLIDNLVIESVSQESIPDVSSFSRFVVTVPFVKGYKQYYKLDKEKKILGINQSSEAELGICDSEVAEKSLNLQNKYMKKVQNLNTEELKAQSVSEFLNNSK